MLPVNVTSLKNASPVLVVTPLALVTALPRAADGCACRPGGAVFSDRHAVVKVLNDGAAVSLAPVPSLSTTRPFHCSGSLNPLRTSTRLPVSARAVVPDMHRCPPVQQARYLGHKFRPH